MNVLTKQLNSNSNLRKTDKDMKNSTNALNDVERLQNSIAVLEIAEESTSLEEQKKSIEVSKTTVKVLCPLCKCQKPSGEIGESPQYVEVEVPVNLTLKVPLKINLEVPVDVEALPQISQYLTPQLPKEEQRLPDDSQVQSPIKQQLPVNLRL